jgi:hypothetical protein
MWSHYRCQNWRSATVREVMRALTLSPASELREAGVTWTAIPVSQCCPLRGSSLVTPVGSRAYTEGSRT